MKQRIVGIFAALLFVFSGILVRLYRLSNGDLKQAAQSQSTVSITVAEARGTIYDRNLVRLTNTGTEYRAAVAPTPQALSVLAETYPDVWAVLQERLQGGKPAVAELGSQPTIADGISLFTVPVRYGSRSLAAHLVGYVGGDGHGASGVEKALDEVLSEAAGHVRVTYETDGRGQVLPGGSMVVENTLEEANAGVVLTLDAQIQRMVEVRGAEWLEKGAVVVLDPATGDILAMASFPTFEPAKLADYLEAADSPLFNRAIAAYNCGSVFKIVSAAAALENGVSLTQTYSCAGSLPVGNNIIKCHYLLGHGEQDMTEGFVHSCNPYFIQLIRGVGPTVLYRMASALNFDSALVLTENFLTASAVFPSLQTLLQPAALANVSFGQGELTATPVHIAQMTASVVNGGVVQPCRLVKGTVDKTGIVTESDLQAPARLYSSQTAAALRDMMQKMVASDSGTAARPAVGGAGGKTGTAETGWKLEDGSTMVQSWFTGFYPADNPQYVITVLSEDAGTSKRTAAPLFKTICDELQRMT